VTKTTSCWTCGWPEFWVGARGQRICCRCHPDPQAPPLNLLVIAAVEAAIVDISPDGIAQTASGLVQLVHQPLRDRPWTPPNPEALVREAAARVAQEADEDHEPSHEDGSKKPLWGRAWAGRRTRKDAPYVSPEKRAHLVAQWRDLMAEFRDRPWAQPERMPAQPAMPRRRRGSR
jgi:hypothetical protein